VEAVQSRQDVLAEDLCVARVTGSRGQRNVEGRPRACAAPALTGRPGSREQGVLVCADIEHVTALFEQVLGAVSVVDVEIDDRDASESGLADQVLGSDRHIVEVAEAHRHGMFGVVTGRTNHRIAPVSRFRADPIGGVETGVHSRRRCLPGTRRQGIVPGIDEEISRLYRIE
jgi:hypothetical protein